MWHLKKTFCLCVAVMAQLSTGCSHRSFEPAQPALFATETLSQASVLAPEEGANQKIQGLLERAQDDLREAPGPAAAQVAETLAIPKAVLAEAPNPRGPLDGRSVNCLTTAHAYLAAAAWQDAVPRADDGEARGALRNTESVTPGRPSPWLDTVRTRCAEEPAGVIKHWKADANCSHGVASGLCCVGFGCNIGIGALPTCNSVLRKCRLVDVKIEVSIGLDREGGGGSSQ